MKRKKVALVVNPRAGQNLAKLSDVLAVLAAAGWKSDLALKEHSGQTMDLAAKAAEMGYDLVIAYGGDGTLNQVVNGVMHAGGQHSIVGVIPGGTTNVWAGEISGCHPESCVVERQRDGIKIKPHFLSSPTISVSKAVVNRFSFVMQRAD